MQTFLSEILDASKALGSKIEVSPLSQNESKQIIAGVWRKFANRTGGASLFGNILAIVAPYIIKMLGSGFLNS